MRILVVVVCLFMAPSAMADTFSSTKAARELLDKVMASVSSGDVEGGLAMLKPFTIVPGAEFDAMVGQTTLKMPMIAQRFGKTIGHESSMKSLSGLRSCVLST
jgi:hypothetical protein